VESGSGGDGRDAEEDDGSAEEGFAGLVAEGKDEQDGGGDEEDGDNGVAGVRQGVARRVLASLRSVVKDKFGGSFPSASSGPCEEGVVAAVTGAGGGDLGLGHGAEEGSRPRCQTA